MGKQQGQRQKKKKKEERKCYYILLQSPQHIALLPDCTSISQTANHKTSCSSVNQRKHYLLVAHHKECQVCLQLWDTANNPTIFVFAHFRTGDKHPQGTYQKGNLRSATWPPSRLPPPGEVTIPDAHLCWHCNQNKRKEQAKTRTDNLNPTWTHKAGLVYQELSVRFCQLLLAVTRNTETEESFTFTISDKKKSKQKHQTN